MKNGIFYTSQSRTRAKKNLIEKMPNVWFIIFKIAIVVAQSKRYWLEQIRSGSFFSDHAVVVVGGGGGSDIFLFESLSTNWKTNKQSARIPHTSQTRVVQTICWQCTNDGHKHTHAVRVGWQETQCEAESEREEKSEWEREPVCALINRSNLNGSRKLDTFMR